jgi:hypothetical protein
MILKIAFQMSKSFLKEEGVREREREKKKNRKTTLNE